MAFLWNVIELVVGLVNSSITIIQFCLAWSVFTGKLIMESFTKCVSYSFNFVSTVVTVVRIMVEEFSYFVADIKNIFCTIESVFIYLYEWLWTTTYGIYNIFTNTLFNILYSIFTLIDNVHEFYHYIMKCLYSAVLTVKGSIILLGNIIWMCFMFIPGLFLYLFSICVSFVNQCSEEIVSIIKTIVYKTYTTFFTICEFITDTPMESVCGLLIGLGVVYLIKKYKHFVFDNLYNMSTKLKCLLITLFKFVKHKTFTYLQEFKNVIYSDRQLRLNGNHEQVPTNFVERLCIVCHDRETAIVIMPCNHLCLCEYCSQHPLFNGHKLGFCPVCRRRITKKLKVYT